MSDPNTLAETPGITTTGSGIQGLSWSILGQTYVPKTLSASSMSWHATFPPGTFVPPHVHPTQDEYVYMLEGRLDVMLDGAEMQANAGDTVRLPLGLPHGLFNNGDRTVKCLFWVSPTRRLFDLFNAIHNVPDPSEVMRLAGLHEVDFLPPPA
ncbi:MAG: cupin domain-containing protein [Beijerinckiaceae bacterium]|nr:cupin domain-containing protein [Beijerinckiaceae bacterium]